jgi:hypothetical protein
MCSDALSLSRLVFCVRVVLDFNIIQSIPAPTMHLRTSGEYGQQENLPSS